MDEIFKNKINPLVLVENFFLDFQGLKKINYLGLDNDFSEIQNYKTVRNMTKPPRGSVNRVVGNLISQPECARVVASYGNDNFTRYSDWTVPEKKRFDILYFNHPKKLIAIYKDLTVATLGCTTIPTDPVFGSSCDFFYDGPRSDGKTTYSSPGLFVWKTDTILCKQFYPGVYPINPRLENEQLFLEALENIQNPTWEDLILEAEKHEQLVFEVKNSSEKPE